MRSFQVVRDDLVAKAVRVLESEGPVLQTDLLWRLNCSKAVFSFVLPDLVRLHGVQVERKWIWIDRNGATDGGKQ